MNHVRATLMIAAIAVVCCKKNESPAPSVTGKDLQFMTKALPANQAEIELGQLASAKASSQGVKAFGSMMASEHANTRADLQYITANNHLSLSSEIDANHQQMKTQLSTASGYTFDTLYIHGQLKDHQAAAALYQSEIDSGKNTMVRNHALKFLPHIKTHLAKADSLMKVLVH
jgi:putative membrane protein